MKINKDLVEALLMISFICLVLIGTSDFQNIITKEIVLGATGVFVLLMAGLRIKAGKQTEDHDPEYN